MTIAYYDIGCNIFRTVYLFHYKRNDKKFENKTFLNKRPSSIYKSFIFAKYARALNDRRSFESSLF